MGAVDEAVVRLVETHLFDSTHLRTAKELSSARGSSDLQLHLLCPSEHIAAVVAVTLRRSRLMAMRDGGPTVAVCPRCDVLVGVRVEKEGGGAMPDMEKALLASTGTGKGKGKGKGKGTKGVKRKERAAGGAGPEVDSEDEEVYFESFFKHARQALPESGAVGGAGDAAAAGVKRRQVGAACEAAVERRTPSATTAELTMMLGLG